MFHISTLWYLDISVICPRALGSRPRKLLGFHRTEDRFLAWFKVILLISTVFKIRFETCRTAAQFWQNLYMTKKESLPDRRKFCRSGSAVRHLFWRLYQTWLYSGVLPVLLIFYSQSPRTGKFRGVCSRHFLLRLQGPHHLNFQGPQAKFEGSLHWNDTLPILQFWGFIGPLTHWGRDKMDAIFQTTFSNGYSWMKIYEFRLKFH